MELGKMNEKGQRTTTKDNARAPAGGSRGLRTVPFERRTFETVSRVFHVHSSISRVISRADVPVFSHTNAATEIGYNTAFSKNGRNEKYGQTPSVVYNCRTSNAWDMDLALTVTYFPHRGLTFAVLFGCHTSTEEEIIKRLTLAGDDITHPLLMPGIVAEIERKRHFYHVDNIVDEIEARIFNLEIRPDAEDEMSVADMERHHKEKRSAWLNISYMRNCLISWQVQLQNMMDQAEEFGQSIERKITSSDEVRKGFGSDHAHTALREEAAMEDQLELSPTETICPDHEFSNHHEHLEKIKSTGYKIKSRIRALKEEYDEKIRDCEMRIEGMAMATQWVSRLSGCQSSAPKVCVQRYHSNSNASDRRHKEKPIWKLPKPQGEIPNTCGPLLL